MTIKEVEERTGLPRSNVRFYEKEKLLSPSRQEGNGYRDYSEGDVENLKKIAYLRTLGISIEDIRNIQSERLTLYEAIRKQEGLLNHQIADLNRAKAMCEKMLGEEPVGYQELQVEQYVEGLQGYWDDHRPVFKLDSVSFLYLWGSRITWVVITALCLAAGLWFYPKLPQQIPIQWNGRGASSLADKVVLFAYPLVCIGIRCLLRPLLYAKMQIRHPYREAVIEYLTNYLCFVALSVEIFSILFVYGVVNHVAAVIAADTAVLIGILLIGLAKKAGLLSKDEPFRLV